MPLLVLAGTPASEDLHRQLKSILGEMTLAHFVSRTGYVTRLALENVAMIIVDGQDPDWRFWTTTPKTSPATRRIPILLISDDSEQRAEALLSGADIAMRRDLLATQLSGLVRDYARVLSPEVSAQLAHECAGELPEMARQGVEKFNRGEYYAQHDLFEALWVQTASPVRDLYRAILQVGVAYYQIERGNYRGALKMLLRSVQWLTILPDVCQGIDIAQLRTDSYRVRAELERLGEAGFAQFDRTLLQPVKFVE